MNKANLQRYMRIGQSATEYAVLLAVVAAAIIAMQVYFKRGIQGRLRDLADQITTEHYEPYGTESYYTTTQEGTTVQTYRRGITRTYQGLKNKHSRPEKSTRSGYEIVTPETQ
jgi:Flp pilus assembly pilin Flp